MTSTDLYKKIIAENFTKTSALSTLAAYSAEVNKAMFKTKTAEKIDGLTRDTAREIIKETREKIEKVEPLVITVAVSLPDTEVTDLGTKIRKMFGEEFLFELNVNTSLLAGAQLVYKGRMLDFSLKDKIENSKPLILDICHKYLS